jgi:hypothetical protein
MIGVVFSLKYSLDISHVMQNPPFLSDFLGKPMGFSIALLVPRVVAQA